MFQPLAHALRGPLLLLALGLAAGCQSAWRGQEPEPNGAPSARQDGLPYVATVPSEKIKTSLPTYVIEPPDILLIDVVKMVPKAPYHFEPLDILQIQGFNVEPSQPINGQYVIDPNGAVNLGPAYGKVSVQGMTSDEAETAIKKSLEQNFSNPEVSVTLLQSSTQQQIGGEQLVAPDGTINLGSYGRVYVAGMTLAEATTAIEDGLKKFLEMPKVSVDVYAYNSKVYYVVTEGAGYGDVVYKLPVTGNETVLDALAQVNGLQRFSSKNIWIARPAPGGQACDQILPVNWNDIVKGGATATNYQILPGDRLFVAEDKLTALDSLFGRIIAPAERVFGFSLLGIETIQNANRFPLGVPGGVQ